MGLTQNKTFVYKQVPNGFPVAGQDLTVEDRPIDLDQELPPNGLLLQIQDASFDPYLRGKMRDPSVKSYAPAFLPDQPIVNGCIAKVHRSNNDEYKEGDLVLAYLPIAEYAVVKDPKQHQTRKIQNPHNLELANFLGALGMPGLTAWSSLYKIGKPKKGETIFVSSAAGAVGQVVGQVAKKEGLRVIGSVGSDEKLEFIKSLGFDDGFNYKKESPKDALPRLCPDGIDIYFENVGGEHLEAAIDNMNVYGRIPTCGMINDYNTPQEKRVGPKNLFKIVASQLTVQGFLVANPEFGPVYFQEHQEKLGAWIADGSVKTKLDITEGIDNAPQGLIDQLTGKNFGKAVLKIR